MKRRREGYDVRAIANVIIEEADRLGLSLTNIQLNKILYFSHQDYLIERRKPLVSAKIEAWEYGPVFREIYAQFKKFGRNPINEKAKVVDYDTGSYIDARIDLPLEVIDRVRNSVRAYGPMSASQLVSLSHKKDGPWHRVWNYEGIVNVGMEITNELILACEAGHVTHNEVS